MLPSLTEGYLPKYEMAPTCSHVHPRCITTKNEPLWYEGLALETFSPDRVDRPQPRGTQSFTLFRHVQHVIMGFCLTLHAHLPGEMGLTQGNIENQDRLCITLS
jgi:hypothetical protein